MMQTRLADLLQILAELQILAGARRRLLVGDDRAALHRRRAAADRTLDAVPDHEIEPARAALTIGCQHSTGRWIGRGTRVSFSSS